MSISTPFICAYRAFVPSCERILSLHDIWAYGALPPSIPGQAQVPSPSYLASSYPSATAAGSAPNAYTQDNGNTAYTYPRARLLPTTAIKYP
ncbi:hypothetical protein CVT25_014582 [Psilocybe cyanescens]|uniref:Uncharacterized protein n=1 Tax=Psilocybe cyanescens TaxID=93625 RepID=A0A409WRB0_PSICY|nr:hypothetical protein CVT25_014582 [Psilocybe cyanescens]